MLSPIALLVLAIPAAVLVSPEPGIELSAATRVVERGARPQVALSASSVLVVWSVEGTEAQAGVTKACAAYRLYSLERAPLTPARALDCAFGDRPTLSAWSGGFRLASGQRELWLDARGAESAVHGRQNKLVQAVTAELSRRGNSLLIVGQGIECAYEGRCYYTFPGGAQKYLDFRDDGYRMRDLKVASGREGALLTWYQEAWPSGSGHRVAIGFAHPAAASAQPRHIVLGDGLQPAVATLDGKTFALVHGGSGQAPIWLRVVRVTPEVFSASPAPRPLLLSATMVDVQGAPAREATLRYLITLRGGRVVNGSTVVDAEGKFSVRHPDPNDLSRGADVEHFVVWAESPTGYAPLQAPPAGELRLTLLPLPAPLGLLDLRVGDAGGEPWPQPVQVSLVPGMHRGAMSLALPSGHMQRFRNLVPGPQVLMLQAANGRAWAATFQAQPGKRQVATACLLDGARVDLRLTDAPLAEEAPTPKPLPPAPQAESFRVFVDDHPRLLSPLRVTLGLGRRILQDAAVAVELELTDPLGNRSLKSVRYYNTVGRHVGCDPVVGGPPDQCANTYVERAVAGPEMVFEAVLLREPGVYELVVTSGGERVVRRIEVPPGR